MYFNKTNMFDYRFKIIIPKSLNEFELNNWIQIQEEQTIIESNKIMQKILLENEEYISEIEDFLVLECMKEIETEKYLEYYEVLSINSLMINATIVDPDPKEVMLLLYYANKVNINYKTINNLSIFCLIDDVSTKEKKTSFDKELDALEQSSKRVIKETVVSLGVPHVLPKNELISFMESLEKTVTLFGNFYKDSFRFKLQPHQTKVIRWLIERRYNGIIAADTGVGKTLIGLSVAEFLYEVGAVEQIIIICPLSSIQVWKDEIDKHVSMEMMNHTKYLFINYEKLLSKELPNTDRSLVILDEAHRIKNDFSKTCVNFQNYSFKYKIALSATIIDKIEELKYVAKILNLDNPMSGENINPIAAKKIMCNISAKSVGIKKEIEVNIGIDLEKNGKYWEHEKYVEGKYNEEITRIGKLNEFCSFNNYEKFVVTKPNQNKLLELYNILEFQKANQVIIFTSFVKTAEWLNGLLSKKYKTSFVYGEVSDKNRQIEIQNFKNGKTQIMVSTQRVLGISQNLQNANVMVFWDNLWSMLNKVQAKGRILRLNQPKQCFIYNLFYKGTVEEDILKRLEFKEGNLNELLRIVEI